MAILDAKGKKIKRKRKGKLYFFAIEGQIYDLDCSNLTDFRKQLKGDMEKEVVRDTTLQAAFMMALKNVVDYWNSKPGLHPNIYELTHFEKQDEERLKGLMNTLDWFKDQEPPIEHSDIEQIKLKMLTKMFDAIEEMPDAWTEDGKLKPEYAKEYAENMQKAALSSSVDLANL